MGWGGEGGWVTEFLRGGTLLRLGGVGGGVGMFRLRNQPYRVAGSCVPFVLIGIIECFFPRPSPEKIGGAISAII